MTTDRAEMIKNTILGIPAGEYALLTAGELAGRLDAALEQATAANLGLAAALLAAFELEIREACPGCSALTEYSCQRHRGLFAGLVTPAGWVFWSAGDCRSCHARIGWASNMKSGKRAPFDPDGTSHFATCPQADGWRRAPVDP